MKNVYKLSLKGKNILITGGYGHLGKGIVSSLIAHEATVYVLARSSEKFEKAFSNEKTSHLHFQYCDISETASIEKAISVIHQKIGVIDTFINNAFYLKGQSPEKMDHKDFSIGIEGTLNAGFKCIKALIPIMKSQGHGKIINVGSMYGMVAPDFSVYDAAPTFINPPHYGAAKAGLIHLTKYYASYLGKDNILVNAVSPGPFPSEAVQENTEFIEALKQKTALKKIGKPADLGGIFVFLASDGANYITGQNFAVDGGWTIT